MISRFSSNDAALCVSQAEDIVNSLETANQGRPGFRLIAKCLVHSFAGANISSVEPELTQFYRVASNIKVLNSPPHLSKYLLGLARTSPRDISSHIWRKFQTFSA